MRAAEESPRSAVKAVTVDLDGRPSWRGTSTMLQAEVVDALVRSALVEDLGGAGDVTSETVVPAQLRARGSLLAKERGVVSGLAVFARVFEQLEQDVVLTARARDGDSMDSGDLLFELVGSARALLAGERTALNFVQRMCGIASLTRRFVERAGPAVRVVDTRKTTPGLRALEKYAVTCGGGVNHRFGLYDEAMIKNNHVDVTGVELFHMVRALRQRHGNDFVVHVEARDEREALAAVAGGGDVVLLDNMSVADMRTLCPKLRAASNGRQFQIEASGGIDLANIEAVGRCGVDRVSVGALTHSAPASDLSFRIEVQP